MGRSTRRRGERTGLAFLERQWWVLVRRRSHSDADDVVAADVGENENDRIEGRRIQGLRRKEAIGRRSEARIPTLVATPTRRTAVPLQIQIQILLLLKTTTKDWHSFDDGGDVVDVVAAAAAASCGGDLNRLTRQRR